MNEWLKRLTESIRNLWAKGTVVQKVVLFALVALVIDAMQGRLRQNRAMEAVEARGATPPAPARVGA